MTLNALVYRLLENSIIMSAAILLLYAMSRLLQNMTTPRLRFACWMVIVMGLLMPIRPAMFTIPVPDGVYLSLSAEELSGQLINNNQSSNTLADDTDTAINDDQLNQTLTISDNTISPDNQHNPSQLANGDRTSAASSLLPLIMKNIPFLLWISGVLVFILVCTIRHIRFARHIRRWSREIVGTTVRQYRYKQQFFKQQNSLEETDITDNSRFDSQYVELTALLDAVCASANLRRNPKLLLCPLVTTPLMMGLIHPVLILPDETIQIERLRFMLLHEIIHNKRGDTWAKLFSLVAIAIHWFNPLVWLMSQRMMNEAELACDAAVLQYVGSEQRIGYGETIIHAARRGWEVSTLLVSAFSSDSKSLKRRLSEIVERRTARQWVTISCAIIMLLVLISVGLFNFGRYAGIGRDALDNENSDTDYMYSNIIENGDEYLAGKDYYNALKAYQDAQTAYNNLYEDTGTHTEVMVEEKEKISEKIVLAENYIMVDYLIKLGEIDDREERYQVALNKFEEAKALTMTISDAVLTQSLDNLIADTIRRMNTSVAGDQIQQIQRLLLNAEENSEYDVALQYCDELISKYYYYQAREDRTRIKEKLILLQESAAYEEMAKKLEEDERYADAKTCYEYVLGIYIEMGLDVSDERYLNTLEEIRRLEQFNDD